MNTNQITAGTIVNIMYNECMGKYTKYVLALVSRKTRKLIDVKLYVLLNIDNTVDEPSYGRYKNAVKFKKLKSDPFITIDELRSAFFNTATNITVNPEDGEVYVIEEPVWIYG